ncbi:MAG: FAD-dependent oxidoreductase [Promethearchaeota archaeon]
MEGSVLVIGGGIAGIQTSLDLTDLGFKVYLIEKKPSIGGHVAQLERTFPNNDCALCILAPKMVEIFRNPNIKLYTLSKVKKVMGKAGDFTVIIEKKPRYVNEDKCRGCGDCAAKCPKIEAPNLFDMNLGKRKSIYIPFPQATPPIYLIDPKMCLYLNRNVCGVCKKICKAGAIEYEQTIQEIELKVGAIVVATGFDMLGEELTPRWGYQYKNVVNALEYERILSTSGPFGGQILRPSDEQTPKKVAFIQCAGSIDLTENIPYCSRVCCLYSAKEAVLTSKQNIKSYIFRHKFRAFGRNFYEFAKEAQNDYDVKYYQAKIYNIKEDPKTNDLIINYQDLGTGKNKKFQTNMVVLAAPLVYSAGTKKLAKILGIKLDKYGFFQERSYFNKSLSSRDGIFLCGYCQDPMDISETVADASAVASQVSNLLKPVRFTKLVKTRADSSREKEMIEITQEALIIGGGISGMTAALNISNQGYKTYIIEKEKEMGGNLRFLNILYPIQEKASIFLNKIIEEVENNSNIKIFLNSKIKDITGSIGNYNISIEDSKGIKHKITVGTIIIATGGKEFEPKGFYQYKKENKNIITQLELEKKLKESNFTWLNEINHITSILCVGARQKGGISYCSNVCCTNTIKNINVLEKIKPDLRMLVFFRDLHMAKKEFEDYFSEKNKTAKFIRYSPNNIPQITKINENPERYSVKIKDETNPENYIEFKTDLILLSAPMIPSDNIVKLAGMLNVPLDKNGFFIEAHSKLRPLDFANHGIFLCGCAQWPKNVQDSISQANGAAARASRFLSLKRVSPNKLKFLSFMLSIECHFKDMLVNTEKCNGCGRCVENCTFKAISLVNVDKEFEDISFSMKKAFINPALCKGCGKCASTCRLKAISARHFDFNQISAIINPFFLEKSESKEDIETSLLIH